MATVAKIKDDAADAARAAPADAAEPVPVSGQADIAIASAHARLAQARVDLHEGGLKKTGSAPNRRGGYFELGDFIVPAQKVLHANGLVGVVSYPNGTARLEIVNTDDPSDRIVIEGPLGSAKLPNCHEVQNIGAVQTYQRRYLWMTALEIVEHDALEGSEVAEPSAPSATPEMPDAEWAKLASLLKATSADTGAMLKHFGVQNLRQLNQQQYGEAVELLNKKLAKMAKAETDAKASTLAEELGDDIAF